MLNYSDIFAASLSDALVTVVRKIPYCWAFLIFTGKQEATKPIRYIQVTKQQLTKENYSEQGKI